MQQVCGIKSLGVRIPDDLRQCLKHQALDNRRSLNDEVLARLEESVKRQNDTIAGVKKNGLGTR